MSFSFFQACSVAEAESFCLDSHSLYRYERFRLECSFKNEVKQPIYEKLKRPWDLALHRIRSKCYCAFDTKVKCWNCYPSQPHFCLLWCPLVSHANQLLLKIQPFIILTKLLYWSDVCFGCMPFWILHYTSSVWIISSKMKLMCFPSHLGGSQISIGPRVATNSSRTSWLIALSFAGQRTIIFS